MARNLKKEAEDLGIEVDRRWSDDTLKRKIDEAKAEGDPANHEPAQSEETANDAGEGTRGDLVAERKNADGRTNPVDFVKNTDPGPGNPDQRAIDPKTLTDAKPVAEPQIVADKAIDNDGNEMKTEETPKVVHETVTASGNREVTNNTIPDQSQRSPLVIAAEAIGIMVDPSWDDNRLRGEMQMALEGRGDLQIKGAIPPKEMGDEGYDTSTRAAKVPVKLNADYWDKDGNRHSKDDEVDLDTSEAKRLIGSGAASRNDPLPGDR